MENLPVMVLSKREFDHTMNHYNLNDDNIEQNFVKFAIISINNTDDDLLLPFFKDNHENVLNLFFDDVTEDLYNDDFLICKAMTEDDAKKIIEFIDRNKDRNFIVHCSAGISRSGAVGTFITEYLEKDYKLFKEHNKHISPNHMVLSMLNKLIWTKTLNK